MCPFLWNPDDGGGGGVDDGIFLNVVYVIRYSWIVFATEVQTLHKHERCVAIAQRFFCALYAVKDVIVRNNNKNRSIGWGKKDSNDNKKSCSRLVFKWRVFFDFWKYFVKRSRVHIAGAHASREVTFFPINSLNKNFSKTINPR